MRALECGAVVGRSFTPAAIRELLPAADRPGLDRRLSSLTRRRFVRPDRLALDEGFRFEHALIRDAVYDAIPKARRADLHVERAARLAARNGEDALVGYHLEQAFLLRQELGQRDLALAATAGRRLRAAGEEAIAHTDVPAAVALLERARVLVPEDDPGLPGLLTELAYSRRKLGEFASAQNELEQALETAARLSDREAELHALIERQFARSWVASTAAADEDLRLAREARAELEPAGDDLGLAWAWWLESDGELRTCRWRERAEALEHALEHAHRAEPRLDFVSTFSGLLGQALFYGPTPVVQAIPRVEALLREAGDPAVRATLKVSRAGLLAMVGATDEARRVYRDAAAVFDDLGLRLRRANHALIGAQIERLAWNPAAAERELRAAREVLATLGARAVAATHTAVLADVLCTLKRADEAEALAREAADSTPVDDIGTNVVWRSALARALLRRGDPAEAQRLGDEALALSRGLRLPRRAPHRARRGAGARDRSWTAGRDRCPARRGRRRCALEGQHRGAHPRGRRRRTGRRCGRLTRPGRADSTCTAARLSHQPPPDCHIKRAKVTVVTLTTVR